MHQVELAALNYQKTRLVRVQKGGTRLGFGVGGEAEVVSARGYGSCFLQVSLQYSLSEEFHLSLAEACRKL